jgi:hypothetical protein
MRAGGGGSPIAIDKLLTAYEAWDSDKLTGHRHGHDDIVNVKNIGHRNIYLFIIINKISTLFIDI